MVKVSVNLAPTNFAFLLLHDFTLISLASALEPLRMANRICGAQTYQYKTLSIDGAPVVASSGLSVNVDGSVRDADALAGVDAVIVCGGRRVENNVSREVIDALKSLSTQGRALGATCTGSFALAKAGLLEGYRCSVHWENMSSLADVYPNVTVSRSVFTIDRDRYTSSGGTTPLDMMLHFITRRCGREVSAGVAEQFIYERIRRSDDRQRVPLKHVLVNGSEKLVVAVELMEANIREPISQEELAGYVGLSRRQLQRLFLRHLHQTPSRYYLQLRLQRARELLRQTGMSLVEISALCGFVSTSHFSKSYKLLYGYSPTAERKMDEVDTDEEV